MSGTEIQLVRFHRHSRKFRRKLETMCPTIQILSGGHQKCGVLLTVAAGKGPWRVLILFGENCEEAKNVEVGIEKLEHTGPVVRRSISA